MSKSRLGIYLAVSTLLVAFVVCFNYLSANNEISGEKDWLMMTSIILPVLLLSPLVYLILKRDLSQLKEYSLGIIDKLSPGEAEFSQNDSCDFDVLLEQISKNASELLNQKTQQEKALKELKKEACYVRYQYERLNSVIESFPFGVIIIDSDNNKIFQNTKVSSLLGCNYEDACDASANIDEKVKKYFNRVAHSHSSINLAPLEFSPNDDGRITEISVFSLVDQKQEIGILGKVILLRDISLEALSKQNHTEFVSHVSHELKTPLNTIAMYSEILSECNDMGTVTESVNVIRDQVDRMTGLINNILSLTKIETGNIKIDRQYIKLKELVEDVYESAKSGCQKANLQFTLSLPEDITNIIADKALLGIAISNLVSNAIKYSKSQGTVSLTVTEDDARVYISVSDTGIGISEDDQMKIFDKFFRSESIEARKRSGHGLGLSLTNNIIQMHHGSLRIESELDQGTTFTIELDKTDNDLRKVVSQ